MFNLGNDIVDLSASRAKLKHLDQRFVKRVFSPNEQAAIKEALDPSTTLWAIWAAKEAAFKACQQQDCGLILAHNKFSVVGSSLVELQALPKKLSSTNNNNSINEIFGLLQYNNHFLSVWWQISKHSVHCMAVLAEKNHNSLFKAWQQIGYNIFPIIPREQFLNLVLLQNMKNHCTEQELDSVFSHESLQTRYYAKKFIKLYCNETSVEIIRPRTVVNNIKRFGPPVVFSNNINLNNTGISLTHDGNLGAVAMVIRK